MADHPDAWYIRLPDGRVLRAGTTAAVRHHLESGRIPPESRVRHSSREAWMLVEAREEFADLVRRRHHTPLPPNRAPSRHRPDAHPTPQAPKRRAGPGNHLGLQTVGVPGCVQELLKALDTTLVRAKLAPALVVGLAGAAVLVAVQLLRPGQDLWAPFPWVIAGLAILVIQALGAAWITQSTFVELSRLRPASPREARAGLARNTARLALAQAVVVGVFVGLLVGLGRFETALAELEPPEAIAGAAAALRLVVGVVLWPVLGLSLLLAPVVVVAECSALRALTQWVGLLRQHLGRAFVYEALAAGLAAVVSFPLVFPVALAAWSCSPAELANPVVSTALAVLGGLALTLLFAYLTVANVYVYLNLKYEQQPAGH